jgi:hypothetical protein
MTGAKAFSKLLVLSGTDIRRRYCTSQLTQLRTLYGIVPSSTENSPARSFELTNLSPQCCDSYYGRTLVNGRTNKLKFVNDKKLIDGSRTTWYPLSLEEARTGKYEQDTFLVVQPCHQSLQMDLHIDRNIAQLVGPEDAARYFVRLFGCRRAASSSHYLRAAPHAFLITDPAVQAVRPSIPIKPTEGHSITRH